MNAYIVVGPTKVQPRFFRSLLIATDSGDVAGMAPNARLVDCNPPALEHRDRFGNDLDTIVYHPAYREMEKIGFEDFKMHAMCHAPGHFGLDRPAPQMAKYVFQYSYCVISS